MNDIDECWEANDENFDWDEAWKDVSAMDRFKEFKKHPEKFKKEMLDVGSGMEPDDIRAVLEHNNKVATDVLVHIDELEREVWQKALMEAKRVLEPEIRKQVEDEVRAEFLAKAKAEELRKEKAKESAIKEKADLKKFHDVGTDEKVKKVLDEDCPILFKFWPFNRIFKY